MGSYRKIQVEKAITKSEPDYVPMLYFNKDKADSDIILVDIIEHYGGENHDTSEWGFKWKRIDKTMGQPSTPLIQGMNDLEKVHIPKVDKYFRLGNLTKTKEEYGNDRFFLASLVLSGFSVISALRGFSEILMDLYDNPTHLSPLLDMVFSFEERVIILLKDQGFDGVAFFDDWGMQKTMIISPELWRKVFKPQYKRQFCIAHECGLKVYFHSCGYYYDIIGDLIEIGVDMLNISQPNLYNIPKLGSDFGGKVTFVCPVSYQTTSISGTRDEIFQDVAELVKHLGCFKGGLIGYIEEYSTIGMSQDNYRACVEAFKDQGRYILE